MDYPYFVARFPVTLAQWREHVQHIGGAPRGERRLRGRDNDPALYVSWHDALGFCDALTQRWRVLLPKGFVVTLPSEAEWEKAARGGERIPAESDWLTVQQLGRGLGTAAGAAQVRNPFPRRSYPWGESFDADRANAEVVHRRKQRGRLLSRG